MHVTVLGLGGAPLGDLYERIPEERALATVRRAYELGVRLFDTAPLYGHGLSEHRFGHVLRQIEDRVGFVLSTKVARYLRPESPGTVERGLFRGGLNFSIVPDYSYDGAMRAFDQSLQRLGMDRVDVAHIHDVDVWTWGSEEAFQQRFREAMEGAYRALHDLRAQGVIRAIGVGVNEIKPMLMFAAAGDFDTFMLAGRYTLLEQEPLDELLPLCAQKGIGILTAGPFNSGILATGAVEGAKYNYHPAPPEIAERVRRLQAVCGRHGVPLAAAAVQFPLAHPAVCSMVPGAVRPEEVDANVRLIETPVPADLWEELKREKLIREDAPTPA
ncbi:MAG: aldo/keto reductase [Acetobacteraceae bacterium]|nr:aldo/keto reductase [Acetobacteraceae bacterium]